MKRSTITLPDELEQALEAYRRDQEVDQPLTAIIQSALRQFLSSRGYLSSAPPLRITPAPHGSGRHDVSIHHDRDIAGG
jgi:hypothetical protein